MRPRGYILFVGRLVPENNAHVLLEAFSGLDTDLRLVVVGDAPYEARYQEHLRATFGSDPRVVFTGYLFDEGYRELSRNAEIFVVPSEAGGSHPVLLEAICAGNCVVVNDHEPNLEVLGDAGLSYPGAEGAAGLRRTLQGLIDDPPRIVALRAAAAVARSRPALVGCRHRRLRAARPRRDRRASPACLTAAARVVL